MGDGNNIRRTHGETGMAARVHLTLTVGNRQSNARDVNWQRIYAVYVYMQQLANVYLRTLLCRWKS